MQLWVRDYDVHDVIDSVNQFKMRKNTRKFSQRMQKSPKMQENSFRYHGNQYGRQILDREVVIFMTPCIS